MKSYLSPEIQELAKRQVAICRIFSNPQRVMILWFLAEKERTVTEIALAIGASLQSTSQHLHIMGFNKLVESRREHHNIYYHIADNELLKNCTILADRPRDKLVEVTLF